MTKTFQVSIVLIALLFAVPVFAYADEATARLGGGNAGLRGGGVSHANPTSNIVSRMSFAGTQGGQPEESSAGNPIGNSASSNGAGGGASGGNGGSGGNSAPGGLIRAGSVVSNSNSVNAINTVIVRIGH